MRAIWMAAALTAVSSLAAPAMAQVDEGAKQVLMESATAMKKTEGVQFKVRKYGTGMLKDIIDSDGTVKIWRPKGAANPTWMVEGRVKQPGQADKKLVVVSDGNTTRWLSQSDNTLYERASSDAQAQIETSLTQQLMLAEFVMGTPFEREMKFDKLTKVGIDNVNGEVCDIIEAMPADGSRNITWAISVADRLPRRLELGTGSLAQKISMVTEMTDVKANMNFTPKDFEIALPVGYVRNALSAAPPASVQPTMPQQPAVDIGLKTGTPAPVFTAKDSTGRDVNLGTMKGNVVVLEFWGPMFKQSTAHSLEMQALFQEYAGKKVLFHGMTCRAPSEKIASDYWTSNNMGYPMIPAADKIATEYKVSGFPTYVVIGADGNIAGFFQDFPGKERMRTAIDGSMAK